MTDDIRRELHHRAMIALYADYGDDSMLDEGPTDIETLTQIDETIYRLDMPEHGATAQVYGFYTEEGILHYALAGVQGEAFTLIYINKEV